MFILPDPDEFFDSVFFVDPVTHIIDDSLVMALSKDPLNSERYSKFLQVRSVPSSPSVDDDTNFELCLPRSVQSLSERASFVESLASFIKSNISDAQVSSSSDGSKSSDGSEPSSNDVSNS